MEACELDTTVNLHFHSFFYWHVTLWTSWKLHSVNWEAVPRHSRKAGKKKDRKRDRWEGSSVRCCESERERERGPLVVSGREDPITRQPGQAHVFGEQDCCNKYWPCKDSITHLANTQHEANYLEANINYNVLVNENRKSNWRIKMIVLFGLWGNII